MVVKLTFVTNTICDWVESYISPFEKMMGGEVKIDLVSYSEDPFGQLFETITSTAKSQSDLFSGFISPPSPMGDVAPLNGWADLTDFIKENGLLDDWVDILPAYRENVASYESKILSYPLDGDIFLYYYNKAIFDAFNLTVPSTWEEYNNVAKALHGKTFEGETLSGSCLGRTAGCAGAYWAQSVLSTMTQTEGSATGSLFSTKDMAPLTGKAMEKTLEIMKESVKYGSPNEFDGCWEINIADLNAGTCAQTINWGNQFTEYLKSGSTLIGRLGIAQTPGSDTVLDRETNELVECTGETCPNAVVRGGKLINTAAYLAFGGWSCAVSNFIDEQSKDLAMKFCAFVSSGAANVPQAFGSATGEQHSGQDPVRFSQLNAQTYTARGYEEATTKEYLANIETGLSSPNVVIDTRFPQSPAIMAVLDSETHSYLNDNAASSGLTTANVVENIDSEWANIVTDYNEQPTTTTPILQVYQQLRGVYVAPEQGDGNGNNTTAIIVGSVIGGVFFLIILYLLYRMNKLNKKLEEMEKRGEAVPKMSIARRATSILKPVDQVVQDSIRKSEAKKQKA